MDFLYTHYDLCSKNRGCYSCFSISLSDTIIHFESFFYVLAFAPTDCKLINQFMVVDHMSAHNRKVTTAKGK